MAGYRAESNRAANPMVPKAVLSASFKPGFVVGGFADWQLRENWVLRSGLDIVVKGGNEKGIYHDVNGISYPYETRYNFTAFDLPLNLLYKKRIGQGPFLGGGLVPGILIEGGLNKFDLGANAVVGYAFGAGLELAINYNQGLLNVAGQYSDYKSLQNRYLGLSLGYRFGKAVASGPATGEQLPEVQKPDTERAKAVYAELGGPGGFLSLNYDTRFRKATSGLGIRFGAGLIFDPYGAGFTLPLAFNYLAGRGPHFLELAGGASFFHFQQRNQDGWFGFEKENFLAPFAWAGYRYQPLHKKFVFRAGFNKFIGPDMPGYLQVPVPGLSFGYSIR
jgi:hypothetical protein